MNLPPPLGLLYHRRYRLVCCLNRVLLIIPDPRVPYTLYLDRCAF